MDHHVGRSLEVLRLGCDEEQRREPGDTPWLDPRLDRLHWVICPGPPVSASTKNGVHRDKVLTRQRFPHGLFGGDPGHRAGIRRCSY